MEGPVPAAVLEYKKTAPYPTWDKSCTPAIPPKLTYTRPLASRAITRARWITGGIPSASTWQSRSSRPRKSIHRPRPAPITPPGTLLRFAKPATSLPHRFKKIYLLPLLYALYSPLSTLFCDKAKKFFQGSYATMGCGISSPSCLRATTCFGIITAK